MRKKILFALVATLVAVGGIAALSAYEAHVINVIARIENALSVTPEEIAFGTVFPQEYLTKPLTISMSDSFFNEDRVDDIEYVIIQKPKPVNPEDWEYCLQNWETASDNFMTCWFDCYEENESEANCWHQCKGILFDYADPQICYPPLCPWLSKMPDGTPDNDYGVMPFQGMFEDARGRLAKSERDLEDTWIIDLIVSCFQGMCAQDYSWEEFGPPLPPELEGETFGCDLWIEVTGISETEHGSECNPGAVYPCDTGLPGVCAEGTKTCDEYGYWGSCIAPDPTAEVCDDDLDNDCDGLTDCEDYSDCFEYAYCEPLSGIAGLWYFDEGEGAIAYDSSGYDNHGIISGATWASPALDFDGIDDYVLVSDDSAIQNIFDGGGSLSVWINPRNDGENNYGRVFFKNGNWSLDVRDESGGKVKLFFYRTFTGDNGSWRTDLVVPINEWSHIVIVYDNDNINNDPTIYVDGASVWFEQIETPTETRISDAGQDLYIGNLKTGSQTFDGLIDEVRVYNRALDSTEVQTLYLQGR